MITHSVSLSCVVAQRHPFMAADGEDRQILVALKSAAATAEPGWPYIRERVKLAVRSRANRVATAQWIAFWNSSPYLSSLARTAPAVLKKIYRPYLTARWSCEERLDALTSHYRFVTNNHLGELVQSSATAPVMLSDICGKSGTAYQVELVSVKTMEREGELVLQLRADGSVIYSVAFTFIGPHSAPAVAVGCVQGGREDDALRAIAAATRDFFGMRPKVLLVRLVQQIGHSLDCGKLHLVGNVNRVMLQQIRKGNVSANYDQTWEEIGALPSQRGDYSLDCAALAEPDYSLIASNKRSAAKKRYALLECTARSVCVAMQRHRGFLWL